MVQEIACSICVPIKWNSINLLHFTQSNTYVAFIICYVMLCSVSLINCCRELQGTQTNDFDFWSHYILSGLKATRQQLGDYTKIRLGWREELLAGRA